MTVAHTTFGFFGQVGQVEEAKRLGVLGPRFRVASTNDWKPAASGSTNRTVTLSAGTGVLCGVGDTTTNADAIACAPNGGGSDRLDAIVASADWGSETISFAVIPGTTTPPVVNPSSTSVNNTMINRIPGLRYDALLAIARVTPGATLFSAGQVIDCRTWGGQSGPAVTGSGKYLTMIDTFPGDQLYATDTDIVWQRYSGGVWGFDKWLGSDKNNQPMLSLHNGLLTIASGDRHLIVEWPDQVNHSQGLLTYDGAGHIVCNYRGRVRIDAYVLSDAPIQGSAIQSVAAPTGGGNYLANLNSLVQRTAGYGGAGSIEQMIPSGPFVVMPGDAIGMIAQQVTLDTRPVDFHAILSLTYV